MPSPSALNINNTTNTLYTNASNYNNNNFNIEHNNGSSSSSGGRNISGNISKELQNTTNTLPLCEDPVIEESKYC